MSTITLPNIRVSSDLTVKVRLKDSGVAIDWSTLNNVKASIYSDAQRALAGRCDVSIDAEDPTLLVCQYAANKPQYVGVNRIVVSAKYHGETKTYDKPAFSFVRWTGDQAGEQITIDDPDVDVEIDVEDVSSSILDEAIRAAFAGAERANDVADSLAGVEADVEAAEALRVAAEESRVEAEEDRVEAEAARVDEEAVRVSAEDARVVAENAREAAEDLREGAEDDRAAAETARETAEAARVAAEALRVSAEGSRESAEAARAAQASADHTVAAGDHTQAAADHTQAAADHTTAASDHTQASSDHTQAAADHTTAAADHTQAQADHAVMEGYDDRLDSVESEVSQLEAKVDEVDEGIGGNYSPGYYNASGDVVSSKEWFVADDYIPVEQGILVWNPGEVGTSPVMLRFDANKQSSGNAYNANAVSRTITIDAVTKYVKPSFAYSNLANAKIVNNGKTIWTPRLATGEIDYRFLTDVNAFINGDNIWKSGTVKCVLMAITPGRAIFVSAGTNPCYIAVLQDNVTTLNTTPNFSQNFQGRFLATDGQIIIVPNDGHYLYISLSANSQDTDSRFFSVSELSREKITESNKYLQAELNKTQELLDDVQDGINYKNVALNSGGINKNNGYPTVGTTSVTDYLAITDGFGIFVKGILGTTVTPLALYDENKVFIESELDSGECFRSADYLKKVGAKYYRCTIGADQLTTGNWYIINTNKVIQPINPVANEVDNLKTVIGTIDGFSETGSSIRLCDAIGNPLNPLSYQTDESGNEIPSTREVLNVQKKAKQLSDIEWTPLASVPNNNGTFPANVKVKGIPYTSVKECDKYVGWDVSIHTFMTAVNNPYSLLYTENVSAEDSQSAWGKTYHGANCSAYFGTVCNEFAKYSAGCDVDFDTPFDKWLHEHRLSFARVFDQSAQGVRIGDIWWQSGHNRIITGIKRNEDGDVTNVIVSEAVNIKVIVTEMTASAFDALIASQHAIIYRSIELYMNRYTPSPYIPLGDEDATPVTYNDDICTFAGDRATFREGDTIVIDYNLKSVGAWTEMELYKNDELVDTITIDSSAHYVNLTSRNLAYGKYKARMKNGSNYSDFTYWEILQTTVSHAFVAGKSSVTFSSNNGKPWYYILGTQAGNRTVMNSLTDEELSAGKVVVDFNAMQKQQRYNDTDLTGTYYLKVKFRGDYGCVTNDPIPVVF